MTDPKEFLKSKGWDPDNPLTGGSITGISELLQEYKVVVLKDVKFGFDLCSDWSTHCLGYRNLVDKIRREEENKPIDKSISPIKPYKNE
jgi:hypothetical protein